MNLISVARRFAASGALLAVFASATHAQSLLGLTAGTMVRVSGDRATNDGVKRFWTRGTLVGLDSSHIFVQQTQSAPLDTIALLGIRRLERFHGPRSRRSMIVTGTVAGALIGVVGWLAGRQLQGTEQVPDENGVMREVYARRLTRYGLVVLPVSGALVGALIGRDQWIRVPVPMSEFEGAR